MSSNKNCFFRTVIAVATIFFLTGQFLSRTVNTVVPCRDVTSAINIPSMWNENMW